MNRMQKEEDSEQYPGYCMPYEAPGTVDAETSGGNTTIRNQDEDDMIAAVYEMTPIITAPLGMEDDAHCQGIYRRGSVGGS